MCMVLMSTLKFRSRNFGVIFSNYQSTNYYLKKLIFFLDSTKNQNNFCRHQNSQKVNFFLDSTKNKKNFFCRHRNFVRPTKLRLFKSEFLGYYSTINPNLYLYKRYYISKMYLKYLMDSRNIPKKIKITLL